jgi:CheY-like chemotaxis protein
MHLPDMDGVAFARAVKSDPALAETKLLVMTARESPLDPSTSASLGFAGWVSKPPKPKELYERLATVIEPHKSPNYKAA